MVAAMFQGHNLIGSTPVATFFLFPLTNAGYLRMVVNMKKNMALVKKKSLIHIDRATIFL